MRLNWLESKAVSILFLCSAVVILGLCGFTCLLAIPDVPRFLNSSAAKDPLGILFSALVVLGIPSVVVLFCGMAIFCAFMNHSIRTKVLWFVLFFGTGPIGSTVYYFAVYRGSVVKRQRVPSAAVGQS
jgi:hypothetical protein